MERIPGAFQPEINRWHAINADLIVPHGPSDEELGRAFDLMAGRGDAYVDASATDRRGLHASGRGVLSCHHLHLKEPGTLFRRDPWSLGDLAPGTGRDVRDFAISVSSRTSGEVCGVCPLGFHVRSGVFILGNDSPQEFILPIGVDRAGVWKASERPVVCANLGGVACVSLPCLLREFPGMAGVVRFVLDHPHAHRCVREVPFSAAGADGLGYKVGVLTMATIGHVAECLWLSGAPLADVYGEYLAAFAMFPELRPYIDFDRFIYASNDPLRRSPFREDCEAWRRGAMVLPHWGGRFMPDAVPTLEIPPSDVSVMRALVARKAARDGLQSARAVASGLVEVVDDRVREVVLPGPSGARIRLEFIGGRLHVFVPTLLRLADPMIIAAGVEDAVIAAVDRGFPETALHRANALMGPGRPAAGSWWLDVVQAAAFVEACGVVATSALEAFLGEVETRVLPGQRRDLCAALPQTSQDGEVVLGMVVKGKLMPIVVDDQGVPWLSQVQIGGFGDWTKGAVTRAVQRLGLAPGAPGVSRRRSVALDGKDRVQTHYDMAACLRIAVELRSFGMVSALNALSSLMGGFGVGRVDLETLKVVPALDRVVDVDLGL